MKIYSWNMLFRNRELDRAFAFIRDADFDIFCLQEVPEAFLERLKTLSVSIASAPETDRIYKGERSTQYAVILSRFPIAREGRLPLPYRDLYFLRRGQLFTRLMLALHLWAKGVGDRHALYADLETPHGTIRTFGLHLSLTHPAWRLEELEHVLAERDLSRPAIVCGDFNIVEQPHISILNWFLGGSPSDTLLWRRERTHIEKRFVEHELQNPLRGSATHPLSRSQLDHILVSNSFSVRNASVIPDRYGSDHHPIRVETMDK